MFICVNAYKRSLTVLCLAGLNFYDALRAGKHFNLLAVACIFATLVAVDVSC
jgi:hypothetical protein